MARHNMEDGGGRVAGGGAKAARSQAHRGAGACGGRVAGWRVRRESWWPSDGSSEAIPQTLDIGGSESCWL